MRGAIVLVPTNRHVDAALLDGREAESFPSFMRSLAESGDLRAAPPGATVLSAFRAMADAAPPGGPPVPSGEASFALARAVDQTLGALRGAGARPRALLETGDPRGAWLARVFESADRLLCDRKLFDGRGAGFHAAEAAARLPASSLPERVLVDGWLSWSPAEFALVEALASRVPVTVRIPHCHHDGHARGVLWDDSIVALLERRWATSQAPIELELSDVEPRTPDRLLEAANDEAECRAIASVVLEALDGGALPERIGILVPEFDEAFVEPLRAHLERAGIGYSEPRNRHVAASPLGSAALAWLDLLAGPVHKRQLADLLETIPSDAPMLANHGFRPESTQASRARLLARLPVGIDPEGRLMFAALETEKAPSPEAAMRSLLAAIFRDLSSGRTPATRAEFAGVLRRSWTQLGLLELPNDVFAVAVSAHAKGSSLAAASLKDGAASLRAILAAVQAVVTAASAMGLDRETIDVARFRGELEHALSSVPEQRATRRPGTVRMVRPSEASAASWDLLVVTRGGAAPASASDGALLLDDALLSGLPEGLRPTTPALARAIHVVETGLATARSLRCVATRRANDAEGRPEAPSPWFAAWAQKVSVEREPASVLSSILSPSPADAELRLAARGGPVGPDVLSRQAIEKGRLAFYFDPEAAPGPHDGGLDPSRPGVEEFLSRRLGKRAEHPVAVTTIERAADCRFAAWAESLLFAKSEDEADEAMAPASRGSLVHRGLKAAFDAVMPPGPGANAAELVARALAKARKAVAFRGASRLHQAEIDRALLDVEAALWHALAETDDPLRYALGEQPFGGARDAWRPLALGSARRRFYLRGRIDRVDRTADGRAIRVVDYKAGTAPEPKLHGVSKFQPLLYAEVARRELGPLFVERLYSVYFAVSRRPVQAVPAKEDAQLVTPERLARLEEHIVSMVERLAAGDVAPRPRDAAMCARCRTRPICRRPSTAPESEGAPPSASEGPA